MEKTKHLSYAFILFKSEWLSITGIDCSFSLDPCNTRAKLCKSAVPNNGALRSAQNKEMDTASISQQMAKEQLLCNHQLALDEMREKYGHEVGAFNFEFNNTDNGNVKP